VSVQPIKVRQCEIIQWERISSENLPPRHGWYLVTYGPVLSLGVNEKPWTWIAAWQDGKWTDQNGLDVTRCVTHWAHMPKAAEGGAK
jgi:hypothetical protein